MSNSDWLEIYKDKIGITSRGSTQFCNTSRGCRAMNLEIAYLSSPDHKSYALRVVL